MTESLFDDMKACFKCGNKKPMDDFYVHPRMKDGHLNKCKECTKLDVVRHRAHNLEKVKAYDRSRPYRKSRTPRDPQKAKARWTFSNAKRDGKIAQQPCQVCGSRISTGHHHDYTKPLEVTWLCWEHHGKMHRKYDYEAL